MSHSTEISHPTQNTELNPHTGHNPYHDIDEKPDEIRVELYKALAHEHPVEAINALERLPLKDIQWRLAGANDIYQREQFTGRVPSEELEEVRNSIKRDAIELSKRRLLPDELTGLGLEAYNFDDAGMERPPDLRDALLIGKSWDSLDKDGLVGELLVRITNHLEPHQTEELQSAFQVALENKDVSFHMALLRIRARTNEFTFDQLRAIERPLTGEPLATNEELAKYGVRKPPTEEIAKAFDLY